VLKFNLFGFPVEIHVTFLFIVVFLIDLNFSALGLAVFVLAIGVSVVVHELGHAVFVRRFGGFVQGIRIYALGGVTLWAERDVPIRGWRRFVVAAAGSGVGLVAGLVLFGLVEAGALGSRARLLIISPVSMALGQADQAGDLLTVFAGVFIWASVFWGLVNWLPIGGLDGSKMLQVVLIRILGPIGDLHARIIGLLVALGVGYWAYQQGYLFAPIIFIMFSLSDLAAYRRRPPPHTYYPPPEDTAHEPDVIEGEEVE
jgi:Zn-dependent protease